MDEDNISDEAKAEIVRIRAEQKADKRVLVSRAGAAAMLDVSTQTIERLEKSGALVSSLDGRVRRIVIAGVYDRVVLKITKSNPKKGPKPKRNPFWGVRFNGKKRKAEAEKRNGGGAVT